jgi:hypothetical protein
MSWDVDFVVSSGEKISKDLMCMIGINFNINVGREREREVAE